ncbi:hypothetical protein [Aquabacterium sp.]|uniref:hypothetical protein n=1 Tax=Aquabacterium sp. TaxID=1872578 RepID=UPI003782D659
METLKFSLLSLKARLAGAVFGVVSSLAVFAAVVVLFASASGETDPVLAKLKPAPAASEALGKLASRSPRG